MEKILVYGKAQNRTALGIVNAYLVMYPHATFADLDKAFPIKLNSSNRHTSLFADVVRDRDKFKTQKEGNDVFEMFFFEKDDEVLTLKDGTRVAFQELWQKEDFNKIVEWAKQYGIVVADYKPTKGYEKGGFTLEYLNGYVPPKVDTKKNLLWLWIALALIVALVIFLLVRPKKVVEVEKVVEKEVVKEVIVHDTVYVQQIAEIEKNFNAAQFEKGKAELNDDAKFVLHDLAKLMEKNPTIKLQIVGHTSAEGDPAVNQKLSEDRAQATVDFLVGRGIDVNRLQAEGKGSSEPIDENNLELNRRTEFIVIE